jgi:hypothetical protein
VHRPTYEGTDEVAKIWETVNSAVSVATVAVRYGFIPFMILYAMKKDPRIRWSNVLSPLPSAPPEGAMMM